MKRIVCLAIMLVSLFAVNAENISGSWNGKLSTGAQSLTIVFNIEGENCTMDSPDQGAFGLKADLKKCTDDSLKVEMPEMNVVFEGVRVGNEIKGSFVQYGYAIPLVLNPGKPHYNRPQTPQPPFPYKEEEVSFVNGADGAVLSGTLVYPETFAKGKTPVVLLVSGSGLQNRDEELFEHRPFAVIADYLARNGIATLRYDDRSAGKSTGDVMNATTETFAADADAGLQFLRDKGEFGKVGLLGHSEGGLIAFMLAGKGKTDFIVSMAGCTVRGDKVLVEQSKLLLPTQGMPETMVADYCRVLEKVYAGKIAYGALAKTNSQMLVGMAVAEAGVTNLPEQLRQNLVNIMSLDDAWMNYFISYDPAETIKQITCPVMAANGTKDLQVVASTNLENLRRLLSVKDGDVIKQYEGLNHLFQHCKTGAVTEYINIEETISPEVLNDIAKFISAQF